jgi:aldose 1-epimerase
LAWQGYPGNVEASITYILIGGTLKAVFEATTDRTSPINMAQHSYFNLGGHSSGNVLSHRLQIKG